MKEVGLATFMGGYRKVRVLIRSLWSCDKVVYMVGMMTVTVFLLLEIYVLIRAHSVF